MTDVYMTLCDSCAERLDAGQHPENRYYLTEVRGSRRTTQCSRCLQLAECTQYSLKSKAILAMERAMAKKKQNGYIQKHDTRARYRGNWREQEQED